MYVPQLSVIWNKSNKIVGLSDSEFLSDFLLIQDSLKRWHCIGIGGQGHIQDSFFHAVGRNITEPFEYIDRVYSGGDRTLEKTDWMWAPYAIYTHDKSKAYMYYHHSVKGDVCQMRMLESADTTLDHWKTVSHPDLEEGCVVFKGKSCRDACIFFDGDVGKYLMYYAANGINMRTSDDLIHWSEPKVVMGVPSEFQAAESPFVVKRFGYYYLFVSGFDYGRVAVYASKDHTCFGNPIRDKLGELNGHAPEIVNVDGKDYIACAAINATDNKDIYRPGSPAQHNIVGVYIQELRWVEQDKAEWLKLPQKQVNENMFIVTEEGDCNFSFDGSIKESVTGAEYRWVDIDNFEPGVLGLALKLDGNTCHVMPSFEFTLGKHFTLSCYIKADNPTEDFGVIFSKGAKAPGHLEMYVTPGGTLGLYQYELGIHNTNVCVTDGEWHHAVFTYDGIKLICYIDSIECYLAEVPDVMFCDNSAPIEFGCYTASDKNRHFFYKGAIDELKIFNRVVNKERIGVI